MGVWNRIVFINDYDGNVSSCYVNGMQAFSDLSYTYCYNGDLGFTNWILADQNCDCTSGFLANFAVVDRVLTPAEAMALGAPEPNGIFGASLGNNYCMANANSTGATGTIRAEGSAVVTDNDFDLVASDLPLNAFGFFIASQAQGFASNPGGSAGNLCLAGSISRFQQQIVSTGTSGSFSITVNLTSFPTPSGQTVAVQSGETWNFQAWHRDSVGGTATSNFTDGLSVNFQ